MSKNGKRYDEQFKKDILRLIQEENRSVSSIVKDFGVNEQTVRNWLKASKERQDPDKSEVAELRAQLKARDKEIADQAITIDILKKATAIFVQNNRK
ncbi:IS3 family transposase [Desulfitobacterium sp. AusDCA]